MAEVVEIPKGDHDSPGPCWIPRYYDGKILKPAIKCNCGRVCHIGLHSVSAEGIVMASFFDSPMESFMHKGKTYQHSPGCGWHVFLKLLNYDQGEFAPDE
jgi:hypothetical protein